MKKLLSIFVMCLFVPLVIAQEETPTPAEISKGEEEAGSIGPENGFLYTFDIVADNIAAFLSRIGGEETHANTVRRIIAERRAEHLRILKLKQEGSITQEEYSDMVSGLNKQISKKEQEISGTGISETTTGKETTGVQLGGKSTWKGKN